MPIITIEIMKIINEREMNNKRKTNKDGNERGEQKL